MQGEKVNEQMHNPDPNSHKQESQASKVEPLEDASERLERIRAQVRNGTYQVDPRQLAKAILKSHRKP